jgi:hypothetical protein
MAKSTRKYGKRSGKKNGGEYTPDEVMGDDGLDWSKSFTIRRFLRMPNLKTSFVGGEKVLQIYMLQHKVDDKVDDKKQTTGTLSKFVNPLKKWVSSSVF